MAGGRIVGNAGDIAHGAMSEALWLNVVGCVRIESWVRINRVCHKEVIVNGGPKKLQFKQ
jgi:hypothetical protein